MGAVAEPSLPERLDDLTRKLVDMLEAGEVEIKSGRDWSEVWKAVRGESARLSGETPTMRHEIDLSRTVEALMAARDGRRANGQTAIEASAVDG